MPATVDRGHWNGKRRRETAVTMTFLLTALVIVVTPGTGVLLTVGAGLSRGARASFVTAVGCTLGIVPHLAAAVTGAAALLRASGTAFDVVKLAGVAYLLLLAVLTWRDKTTLHLEEGHAGQQQRGSIKVMVSAVLANLLNPKLTLFFFAFLPQFIPQQSAHPLAQLLLLSGVFMAMTLVVFVAYGAFAARVRQHVLQRPDVVRRLRQLFALSFVGLSVRLATTER
jgi:threonine/homoserine/homoserine lactone efflux protein